MSGEFYMATVSILMSLGVLPLAIGYFIHRVKAKKLDTIIKVVELGGAVGPEMFKTLGDSGGNFKTGYKCGLIWFANACPTAQAPARISRPAR